MKLPRHFEEYLADGTVRKVSPDLSRAKFFIEERKARWKD